MNKKILGGIMVVGGVLVVAITINGYLDIQKEKKRAEAFQNALYASSDAVSEIKPKKSIMADECKTTFGANTIAYCEGKSKDNSLFIESGADAAVQVCFEEAAAELGRPISEARDIACEVKKAYRHRSFTYDDERDIPGIKHTNYKILNDWMNWPGDEDPSGLTAAPNKNLGVTEPLPTPVEADNSSVPTPSKKVNLLHSYREDTSNGDSLCPAVEVSEHPAGMPDHIRQELSGNVRPVDQRFVESIGTMVWFFGRYGVILNSDQTATSMTEGWIRRNEEMGSGFWRIDDDGLSFRIDRYPLGIECKLGFSFRSPIFYSLDEVNGCGITMECRTNSVSWDGEHSSSPWDNGILTLMEWRGEITPITELDAYIHRLEYK